MNHTKCIFVIYKISLLKERRETEVKVQGTYRWVHFANYFLKHLNVLLIKTFLHLLRFRTHLVSWVLMMGKRDKCAKSSLRTYRWQRLVHVDRIKPPRAKALLFLLLLVLFHGLLNADLGSAPDTFFE